MVVVSFLCDVNATRGCLDNHTSHQINEHAVFVFRGASIECTIAEMLS